MVLDLCILLTDKNNHIFLKQKCHFELPAIAKGIIFMSRAHVRVDTMLSTASQEVC